MEINEYSKLAARTINKDMTRTIMTCHALTGLVSEVGEVASLYQHAIQEGRDGTQKFRVNSDKLADEVGDCLWFINELLTAAGWSLEEVCQKNIDKLRKRYPDGFDADRSKHRHEFGEDAPAATPDSIG